LLKRARKPERKAELQAELLVPPFPDVLTYLWVAFRRLGSRRGSSGFAIDPIGWPDIDAFVRHSGVRLAPWEVRLIEELDDLFRIEQARKETE